MDGEGYEAAYEAIITDYAALPDLAGKQIADFLESLPWFGDLPRDAFLSWEILQSTRNCLRRIIEREKQMKDMASGGGSTKLPKGPTKLDSDIAKSARPDSGQSDATIAMSAWQSNNPDVIHDKVAESARGNADSDARDSAPPDDVPAPDIPDFFGMDPRTCFKFSTKYLADGVVWNCNNPTEQRVAKMIVDYRRVTEREVSEVCMEIYKLTYQLTPPKIELDGLH